MPDTRISTASAIAMNDSLVDRLDGGPAAGRVEIFTGPPPASVDDLDQGTLLATLVLSDPAFGPSADAGDVARAAANTITADLSAAAEGTAGHFRGKDSNGVSVVQDTVSLPGGGGGMELDNTSIRAGQQVNIGSWVIEQPKRRLTPTGP